MFDALGRWIVRRPWTAVLVWLILFGVAGAAMAGAFDGKGLMGRLSSSESMVPGSESDRVLNDFKSKDGTALTLVVTGLNLKDQAKAASYAKFVGEHRADLKVDGVDSVADPFAGPPNDPRSQALFSKDSDGFVAVAKLKKFDVKADETAAHDRAQKALTTFGEKFTKEFGGAQAKLMSQKLIQDSILHQVESDLIKGEAVGLPIALILMVIVFGGLLAAGLPLLGAIVSILIGMGLLWALTYAMGIESFVLNVVTLIGLALSIDYGLLMVSRFREEAHQRLEVLGFPGDGSRLPDRAAQSVIVEDAVRTPLATAGRTVFFSAVTIAVSVCGLLVMKATTLRAIGVGATIVVVLAVATAMTLVPALLAILGHKLLAPSPLTKVPGLKQLIGAVGDVSTDEGIFSKLARWVHKRPWLVFSAVSIILVGLALPLKSLTLRNNFADYIPAKTDVRAAYHTIQDKFPALATPTLNVVAKTTPEKAQDLVSHIKSMPHMEFVAPAQPINDHDGWVRITARMDVADNVGKHATDAVTSLRAHDAGFEKLVGGPPAFQYDFNQSLMKGAPWAALIVILAVGLLLFLMTGSVLMPIKALIVNVLSLASSLGATYFIFRHELFGAPKIAGLETFVFACTIAFGFGLAMDYEVFLLARIKEYYDKIGDLDLAVEKGLQRSGRIITSAAAIIVAVFFGFASGQMLAIKEIGVALAVLIIIDATLVRMLLVPATMTILGHYNWWAPAPLRKLYDRFKIVH